MSRPTLAARQAALVAALVAGAAVPAGFDEGRVRVAERALRAKRAGEVAVAWPRLAAGLGAEWPECFGRWARGRPSKGALADGWDLARELAFLGRLPALAATELAVREVTARYDGTARPRPRRGPALRRVPGGVAVGVLGRAWVFGA
ncbi:hypothetical protein [Pseudonocardia acaciae]|uniref:hypothetical protein n=1 Tax=Pseudonocardia acaciae TaxID=551276 RepID=UPI00048E6650|nr:hypothetical protein [Pseudonocardia acaciae]